MRHHQQLLCGELGINMKKENFIYSAKDNAIYPVALKQIYVDAGTWPDDGAPITDAMADEFSKRPADKFMVTGEDGLPAWEMEPPLTKEQLIAQAEMQKRILMAEAGEKISVLQDAVDFGMATPEEESALKEWKIYRVMLSRVDTSLRADVVWPTPPASPAR